jgi:alkaline phosphatase
MMKHFTLLLLSILIIGFQSCQTPNDQDKKAENNAALNESKVKNIIFLIGDGMGVSQLYAGMTVSKEPLMFEQFKHIGFQKTFSANSYITDSGASGTALATGNKTNNQSIGVGPNGEKLTSILELAEQNGYSTGLVSTSSILHATPASFIAHNESRHNYEEIALDFLRTDIDLFIGGGMKYFKDREDGKNLVDSLKKKGYTVSSDMNEIKTFEKGKLAGFTAEKHNPKFTEGREDMLPVSTQTALNILDNNEKGFFLMVESSQIDWGGHDKDQEYVINEVLDFNEVIKVAMEFTKQNKNTLLVVTADHETGGMALTGGSMKDNKVEATFATDDHTGVMVPVFAYGPGAEEFMGIYDNTDVFKKMLHAYGIQAE